MTQISISGTQFLINQEPTYLGRKFEGHSVEGLLFNVRAVQATFDDANSATRSRWAYPDTGKWDAERNVSGFCAALPSWRDHGVLAVTINLQGGGPNYTAEVYDQFDNNAFTPEGELKTAYADRLARVMAQADALGMVVIVGLFYAAHIKKMKDEQAVWRAAHNALMFLKGTGYRNLLIEVANEIDVILEVSGNQLFEPRRAHEMLERFRQAYPDFLYSTSLMGANVEQGKGMPPASLVETADYVLLHGNGTRAKQLETAIKAVQKNPAYQRNPKPILINEDSPGIPNFEVACRHGVSWGYYDQGYGAAWKWDAYVDFEHEPRETRYEELSGFQTPPVNWMINTDHKRAFFNKVAEITGYPGSR